MTATNEQASSALTPQQIEAGWHDTFSTNNPYCPCDLKTFTKAVRWAERQAAALASDTGERGVNYIAAQQAAFTYGLAYNPFCSALRDYLEATAALRAQPAGGGESTVTAHTHVPGVGDYPTDYVAGHLPEFVADGHEFLASPKLGGEICSQCGAVKGTRRGRERCRYSPGQPAGGGGGEVMGSRETEVPRGIVANLTQPQPVAPPESGGQGEVLAWARNSGDPNDDAFVISAKVKRLWMASNPKRVARYTRRLYSTHVPCWALPAVESALSIMDLQGYWHSDLAAFRDWIKEKSA